MHVILRIDNLECKGGVGLNMFSIIRDEMYIWTYILPILNNVVPSFCASHQKLKVKSTELITEKQKKKYG
jgi:hypothetical protein